MDMLKFEFRLNRTGEFQQSGCFNISTRDRLSSNMWLAGDSMTEPCLEIIFSAPVPYFHLGQKMWVTLNMANWPEDMVKEVVKTHSTLYYCYIQNYQRCKISGHIQKIWITFSQSELEVHV